MELEDFNYELPEGRIAQEPLENRESSKLMVLNKQTGEIQHKNFHQIQEEITQKDCLIFNDTRVLKARLNGRNEQTGGEVEFLLLKRLDEKVWEIICKPAKRVRVNSWFNFSNLIRGKVLENLGEGGKIVEFSYDGDFFSILNKIGSMPLPPYIKTKLNNPERYQTVYSKEVGSAAAPTAGLHFTENLINKIKEKGVRVGFLTLHVGLGTFKPVVEKLIENHLMHSEQYFFPQQTANLINDVKAGGGRVFCVGTTSCRVVESVYLKNGRICGDCGETKIFIYPGFKFNVTDCLITNFHLPKSSLIMLVSAFAERELILKAYDVAIKNNYRFFSFGDAMLIL